MREGAVDGLSIGFRVVEGARERGTGLRRLTKIDLWEISLVTFPMLPGARVGKGRIAIRDVAPARRPAPTSALSLRAKLAEIRLDLSTLRLGRLLARKYNADQPRVPAGSSEGGRWTDGNAAGLALGSRVASRRPLAGLTYRIGGRDVAVTSAQAVRLEFARSDARANINAVVRHDPSWQPKPSIYGDAEGAIAYQQSLAQQAAVRLRELGISPPSARSQADALTPGGMTIGSREPGAGDSIRTAGPTDFTRLLDSAVPGARPIPSPSKYDGSWYRHSDGSTFGLRFSEQYGLTYDVIRNDHPIFRRGYKVHQK